jgi:DNA polymerase-4
MERNIIHFDLDSLFVGVQCKKDKKLIGKPLIIGGNSRRGVVASCSSEARKFGVHPAMPMYLALQLCPDAVVVPGDMEAYSRYSQLVTEVIADSAPSFEKASIDEFYIDMSGIERHQGAFKWASELRTKIEKETDLPISLGMSINKLVSKVATTEFKPRAEKYVVPGTEKEFLSPLPIDKIPMIGKQTSAFLHDMGVRTVATLRNIPLKFLMSAFGKHGLTLWKQAHGIDDTPVVPYAEQKSISAESIFAEDIIDAKRLKSVLTAMAEKVSSQLRDQKKLTSCITVKIRYIDFDAETKQVQIPYTSSDQLIQKVVTQLFDKLYDRRMQIQAVGVVLSGMVHGSHQISLFDDTIQRINLNETLDSIKHNHGPEKVMRQTTMGIDKRMRMEASILKENLV